MALETVGDLRDMSRGHLNIHDRTTNARPGSELAEYDALVWSAHSTSGPEADFSFLGHDLNPFFTSPAGKALLKFGHIRGDVGADEVAEGIMRQLGHHEGFNPLFLAPRMGGRTLMDHNRPLERASLFPVPSEVQTKLNEAYRLSMDTLFAYLQQYRDRVRVVFQPHTMGFGDIQDISDRHGPIGLLADSDFEAYQRDVIELVEQWDDVYSDGCNNGAQRADCDIVTGIFQGKDDQGKHFPYQPIADGGLGEAVRARLDGLGIEGKFNDPFPHMTGYPGTRLAVSAAEAGIPQVTFDLAKRHLLRDGEAFRASTFRPDYQKAMRIGETIARAARDVIG